MIQVFKCFKAASDGANVFIVYKYVCIYSILLTNISIYSFTSRKYLFSAECVWWIWKQALILGWLSKASQQMQKKIFTFLDICVRKKIILCILLQAICCCNFISHTILLLQHLCCYFWKIQNENIWHFHMLKFLCVLSFG